jgi:hypothetical protein
MSNIVHNTLKRGERRFSRLADPRFLFSNRSNRRKKGSNSIINGHTGGDAFRWSGAGQLGSPRVDNDIHERTDKKRTHEPVQFQEPAGTGFVWHLSLSVQSAFDK